VVILDSTFTDNAAAVWGGAIFATDQVTAKESRFTDNHVRGAEELAEGGAIFAVACSCDVAIEIVESTVTGNSVETSHPAPSIVDGGGLTGLGKVDIEDSTIADNSTRAPAAPELFGGGGGVVAGGSLSALNSTITDNEVDMPGGAGGGILSEPEGPLGEPAVELAYTDVVDNSASSGANLAVLNIEAAGVSVLRDSVDRAGVLPEFAEVSSGEVDAQVVPGAETMLASFASVITDPSGGGDNCSGFETTESSGWNFADDDSCDLDESTDSQRESNDPLLGDLADNGGPTETLLPASDSPLVNAVQPQSCQSDGAHGVSVDQRGFPRPAPGHLRCDIGAVEIETETVPLPLVIVPTFTG